MGKVKANRADRRWGACEQSRERELEAIGEVNGMKGRN